MHQNLNTSPEVLLAPMVLGSELAFRMLCRKYGARTCYTPMIRAEDLLAAYRGLATINDKTCESKPTTECQTLSPTEGRTVKPDMLQKCDTKAVSTNALASPENGLMERCIIQESDPTSSTCASTEKGYVEPDNRLCWPRTCDADRPLVVQLCGRDPELLADACRAAVSMLDGQVDGVDLNLGCPQTLAKKWKFGAYLAEDEPALACRCISAMREALPAHIRVSCKIRLMAGEPERTVEFAKMLEDAGCGMLAVHCRRRTDTRHRGSPDWRTGRRIVDALSIPVVINGGVYDSEALEKLRSEVPGCSGVMCAQGFLANHRMLSKSSPTLSASSSTTCSPAELAAEYLEFVERYPPPSSLYVRKHLRWIFRSHLMPKHLNFNTSTTEGEADFDPAEIYGGHDGWRARLWTFLIRPYLRTLLQFRQLVHLYCVLSGDSIPDSISGLPAPSFRAIRRDEESSTAEDVDVFGSEDEGSGMLSLFEDSE